MRAHSFRRSYNTVVLVSFLCSSPVFFSFQELVLVSLQIEKRRKERKNNLEKKKKGKTFGSIAYVVC